MNDLIYNQTKIPKEQWRYGLRSSAATGCGWIAAYNALRLMGYRADPEKLIVCFERQLPLVHGNGGTSFWGPWAFFKRRGFRVGMVTDRKQFDEAAKNADVSILFYRWRRKWKLGAHFVALRHTDSGFVGYNTYRNSQGPDPYGASLDGFLKQRKYFGAILIPIRRPEKAKEEET